MGLDAGLQREAFLVEHATWCLAQKDGRSAAAARRLARTGVDLIVEETDLDDSRRLVRGA